MTLSIKFGDYTFQIMPTFQPKVSLEYDAAKNLSYILESWPMETYLRDDGAVNINTLYDAFKSPVHRPGRQRSRAGTQPGGSTLPLQIILQPLAKGRDGR